MLYDGLFRFLREATVAFEANDRMRAGERLQRANAVLRHLLGGMKPGVNPLLFERLTALYMFAMRQITEANLKQDARPLQDVIKVLLPLRSAWSQAAEQAVRDAAKGRGAADEVNLARTG